MFIKSKMAVFARLLKSSLSSSSRRITARCRTHIRLMSQETSDSDLLQTPLYNFHVTKGGKMVPYAGWSMPVQYTDLSVINSCLHTRENASIFDVSHMLQTELTGKDAERFLEYLTVANLANLKERHGVLSMFTTPKGGIIDDCIITRTGHASFYVVSNAGRANVVQTHMKEELEKFNSDDVIITSLPDKALVALQGPKSSSILQQGVSIDLSTQKFMTSSIMDIFGITNCRVSRCGYTGEDGFEISVDSDRVVHLVETLLSTEQVKLAGLGARDVLRLEAGLCLYGNDISEETTPIEAGLAWCIDKRRRSEGGFLGAETILQQIKDKPSKRRVGLEINSGPPARNGCQVLDATAREIGVITSGSPSPTLKTNIAMAYLPRSLTKIGTEVGVKIRKSLVTGRVVKMPFVPSRYYN